MTPSTSSGHRRPVFDPTASEIQRLHDVGAGVLVTMQHLCEHRGKRMQAYETARRMRERGMDWGLVADVTGIDEADLNGI